MFTTLISPESLLPHLSDPNWVIVDCRFELADTEAGRRQYAAGHIPGALYAHLDEDLSGSPVTDRGRHPLPTPAAMTALFGRLGIDERKQVVVYDASNGAYAARLWWMLQYMGHAATAVLDGGWTAWQSAGLPVSRDVATGRTAVFAGAPHTGWLVQMADVPGVPLLVDSRGPARYRGEIEPIDAKAGHIPGAVSYFYEENWGVDGRYLPPDQLRSKLEVVLRSTPPDEAVFYCGSGVSACANVLAMAHSGLGYGRLYVGSWSEWSRQPGNPVAVGDGNR
ncbi:MAG: sulfurtransferase [Anaerolineae bacterium]|nr:sulfurtransferase [Anaerolineae bacterium]